ncbi:MAG: hypothetical protein HOY71_31720, partial [Nonomuraea sp.]|nr:hypothetical protein [Nonomuraea sp.]
RGNDAGGEVQRDGAPGGEVRRGGAPGGEVRRGGAPGVEVRRDGGPGVELRRDGEAGVRLLAELAEAAIDLLASPDASKVRACEGPGCSLLFLPAHPRRRWCSPAVCGNRARVARYYQRHR